MTLRHLVFITTVCFYSTLVTAKTLPSSVLLPGSRVVAGDLSKNEFFVLASHEDVPLQPMPSHEVKILGKSVHAEEVRSTVSKHERKYVALRDARYARSSGRTDRSLSIKSMHAKHVVKQAPAVYARLAKQRMRMPIRVAQAKTKPFLLSKKIHMRLHATHPKLHVLASKSSMSKKHIAFKRVRPSA